MCRFFYPEDATEPFEHRETLIAAAESVGWSLNQSSVSLTEIRQIKVFLGFRKVTSGHKHIPWNH